MRQVKLSIIAELPTYIAWCEKAYPQYGLEWFKTPHDFQASLGKSNGFIRVILSEFEIETDYPCINLKKINLYTQDNNLTQQIDDVLMYNTLASMFSSNKVAALV